MAKRPTPPPADPTLNADQIRQGIERLRRRIAEVEKFEPTSVKERWASETQALEASIGDTLSRVRSADQEALRSELAGAAGIRDGLQAQTQPDRPFAVSTRQSHPGVERGSGAVYLSKIDRGQH
jgi:hypothetical protein